MTEGASPLAGINKVLRVDSSGEVILCWSDLFVLFPLKLHPITVFAWCWCPLIQHPTRCQRALLLSHVRHRLLFTHRFTAYVIQDYLCTVKIRHIINGLKYIKVQLYTEERNKLNLVYVILFFIWGAEKYFFSKIDKND